MRLNSDYLLIEPFLFTRILRDITRGLASSPKCVMIGPLAGSGNQGDSRLDIVVRENAGVIHGGRETYVTKRSAYLGRN